MNANERKWSIFAFIRAHSRLISPSVPVLILALLCGITFFWRLSANGIWDLDEALYSESAREMRQSGDYVTPRVNGEPFFEKPPLIYWEAAALFRAFGRSELTARLPSALASTAVVALVFCFGSRVFNRRAAFIAAAGFALCPLALGTARQLTTDATLNLCIALALLAFFVADQRRTPHASRLTPLLLLFWAACGLGVLAKGLPGILIPVLVALVYIGFSEQWNVREIIRRAARLRPASGILLFLIIALPWHIAAWRASGEAFYHEYIVVQHLGRFHGGDTAHRAPFWFYVPGFLAGFFPLSLFVPAALVERRRTPSLKKGRGSSHVGIAPLLTKEGPGEVLRLFLKVWAGLVFVMFSASGSKLISYILPMYPAAALLAGDWLDRHIDGGDRKRSLLWVGAFAFPLSCLLLGVAVFHQPIIDLIEAQSHRPVRMDQIPAGTFIWAEHLFAATTAGIAGFLILVALRRPWHGLMALGTGMAAFSAVAVVEGLPLLNRAILEPLDNAARLAGHEAAENGLPLVLNIAPPRRPSVFFYLPDEYVGTGKTIEVARQDPAKLEGFLARNRAAVVLTAEARVDSILASHPTAALAGYEDWVVMRTGITP